MEERNQNDLKNCKKKKSLKIKGVAKAVMIGGERFVPHGVKGSENGEEVGEFLKFFYPNIITWYQSQRHHL